jgi:hypothetical protein
VCGTSAEPSRLGGVLLRSTAIVAPTRAERYRDQLASHSVGMLRQLHQRDHAGAPPIRAATVDDETVVLMLAWGRCTITASDDPLVLVAEAAAPENLARLQNGSAIAWPRSAAATTSPSPGHRPKASPPTAAPASALVAHRGALTKISIVLLVGVVLAVHLGIGAALLGHHWAWWALAAIAIVVALKLVVARHLFAALHGHRSQRR